MKLVHLRPRRDCPPGNVYLTRELTPSGLWRSVVTYHLTTSARLAYASARQLAEEAEMIA